MKGASTEGHLLESGPRSMLAKNRDRSIRQVISIKCSARGFLNKYILFSLVSVVWAQMNPTGGRHRNIYRSD